MERRKNKLILIVSLLLTVGFVATSLSSYYVSRASLRSQIAHGELPLTSDNIYSEIQRDLLRPVFISSLMASDTFLRDWVIQGETDEKKITRYLKEIKEKYHTITSFFVSEQTGIYYHADGILKTVSPQEERDKWYFRVRSMKSDYEINVDLDMANKDSMTVFINYRVFDYADHFIGAVGVGLTVNAVKALIEKYQENYDRNIYFIDRRGELKLHGSSLPDTVGHISEIEGIASLGHEILSKPGGCFQYKRNGRTVHLNTRYIPEFRWFLFVEQTEEKATAPIFNALLVNLAACAVITMIILGLTSVTISFYQTRMEKMAVTDKLTGIYNRQAFDIIVQQSLREVQRKRLPLSIILFDIDDFKKINDEFGHLAGDSVIKNIVNIARESLRKSDVLCRWGGEEFLILLKDCGLDDAYLISEKIRENVCAIPAVHKDKEIGSTISLGVCRYRPDEGEDALFSRVDRLLYQAKRNGKNRSEKEPDPCGPIDEGCATR